jgi:hypothetical protein
MKWRWVQDQTEVTGEQTLIHGLRASINRSVPHSTTSLFQPRCCLRTRVNAPTASCDRNAQVIKLVGNQLVVQRRKRGCPADIVKCLCLGWA